MADKPQINYWKGVAVMYNEILILKEYDIASYMQDRAAGVRKLIDVNGVSLKENKHLIVVSEATLPENAHKHPMDLWTVRGGVPERIQAFNRWGIQTRENAGQSFVMDDILNPTSKVKLLAVTGHAGTGKTFVSMLGAVLKDDIEQILFTREIVPVGREMGFLTGDEHEKFLPFMGGLLDNIETLEAYTHKDLFKRFKPKPMQTMRGRSLKNTVIIVDEAQNSTLEQLKMVISRADIGSIVILLGSLNQIDDPKLRNDNPFEKVIKRFDGQELFSHVHLVNDERSALARLADELLR